MNFLQELKRRHVYRVAAAYAVVGWVLIQVVTQVFPVFALPSWSEQLIVLLILIGFPIALVLAWAFDATPQGIVATDSRDAGSNPRGRQHSRRATQEATSRQFFHANIIFPLNRAAAGETAGHAIIQGTGTPMRQ